MKSRRSGAGAAHYPAKQLPKIQIDGISFSKNFAIFPAS
jgi:hypothetical protein